MCSASKRQRQDASAKGAARSERPGAMRMARAVALALLGLCASAAWAQDGGVDRPAPIRTRPGMSTLAQDPAAGVMNLRERELRRRLEQRQAWARQGSESGRWFERAKAALDLAPKRRDAGDLTGLDRTLSMAEACLQVLQALENMAPLRSGHARASAERRRTATQLQRAERALQTQRTAGGEEQSAAGAKKPARPGHDQQGRMAAPSKASGQGQEAQDAGAP